MKMRGSGFSALVMISTALLQGCASTPRHQPMGHYYKLMQDVSSHRSAVVVSACAERDELGNNYFLLAQARDRARAMAAAAQDRLRDRGAPTAQAPILLMCGGHVASPSTPIHFVEFRADTAAPKPGRFPYLLQAPHSVDAVMAHSLHRLFAEVGQHQQTAEPGLRTQATAIPHMRSQLKQLGKALAVDYVWLISAHSMEVSRGKKLASAVLTAAVTMGYASAIPAGGNVHTTALIDLRKPSLIWSKTSGNLASMRSASVSFIGSSVDGGRTPMRVSPQWTAALFSPLLSAHSADVAPDQPSMLARRDTEVALTTDH